jgi:hypothetical protein
MHSLIIQVIIYFGRIIIDIIVYEKKRKMYIIFGKKIKYMPSLWHGGRLVSSNKHFLKPLKSPLVYLYKNGIIETLSQQN